MPFQPEKLGPEMIMAVHRILTAGGLRVSHIEVSYDGSEDEGSYSMGSHLFPEGHNKCHAFNLASAIRGVTPDGPPEVNALFIRYFDDGTSVLAPASLGIEMADGEDEEE